MPDPASIQSEPHQYCFSRYSGSQFVPVNNHDLPAGFYRVQRNGLQSIPKNVLRTNDNQWLNGDYASLRFISLTLYGQQPKGQLYPDGTFVTPLFQRWPTLYERVPCPC